MIKPASFAALVFMIAGVLFQAASADSMAEKPYEQVMQEMLDRQGSKSVDAVDCKKVSEADFEELGDALMEKMVGSHMLHEQMDEMMGGEESESLRSVHILMGKNWLGCQTSYGMMGGMRPMMMGMMGNYYPAYYSGYDTLLLIAVIGWVMALILFVTYLMNRKNITGDRKGRK
ncbi:MAG: hypothetical protein HYX24_04760 [Candidatus Aenigmarchaeota archaeon]|nr:hypothetical protein [Candidatus Aenigmarchaeota archaeon]